VKIMKKRAVLSIAVMTLLTTFLILSCSGEKKEEAKANTATQNASTEKKEVNPMDNKGIGPIKNVTLGEIDPGRAAKGKEIFQAKCSACHKETKKYIGPAPQGVLTRRSPEWIMNMILNPEEMVKNDDIAKKLFEEFMYVPMANQSLTEDEARSVLEYFRTL